MKKMFSYVIISALLIALSCALCPNVVRAEEGAVTPGAFYAFDEDLHDKWMGENDTLDSMMYDGGYEAAALRTYNMGWANRFGGVAIKGVDLDFTVSATKNRYMVVSLIPDEICVDNAFDSLMLIYYKTGSDTVYYGTGEGSVDSKAFSGIHGASTDDFTKIIVDLAWEEEFSLETLRLDMFSSSLGSASSDADGAYCGTLYINYIAFFDTAEDAEAFQYPASSSQPETPTEAPEDSEPGEENTPDAPATETPDEDSNTKAPATPTQTPATPSADAGERNSSGGGSRLFIIIAVCVVVAAAAVGIIIWIFKKK